ncbi:MAG: UDP-N-acetyl-alpha-D-glucosamine C6 dehydratase [Firmicutes bacterium ADurb.Bin193]|nr:MAG: UDP-N-acetyl-alpha-D-glucosamine C6 dehydratase [Firmicutes bacterium ADurb.Bin193]
MYLRKMKKLLFWLLDIICVGLAFLTAMLFLWGSISADKMFSLQITLNVMVLVYTIFFRVFSIYRNILKQAGIYDYLKIIAVSGSAMLFGCAVCLFIPQALPLKVNLLACIFSIIFITGFRISVRVLFETPFFVPGRFEKGENKSSAAKEILIIGAGNAAKIIISDIYKNPRLAYHIVGLIDDDPYKQGCYISGYKVLGGRNAIVDICAERKVDEILIAIPSASENEIQKIVSICSETNCKTRLLPSVDQILYANTGIYNQARDVSIEDLLSRKPIELDNEEISKDLEGKVVLVTGGGGSIGSELCRQIAKLNPKKIIILDIYENNAYDLQNELNALYPSLDILVLIASVTDMPQLDCIFRRYKPYIVFHAAAHKHVPLMEINPEEAVKNNVFGTFNVAKCADAYCVRKFVLISTDKAVNPTNVMGATKRVCEMIVQSMQHVSKTKFVAVRFGNVLGSNGSVVPLFHRQIKNGGPVTVTHEEITRFFMTIPEAAQLVLQASSYAKGGEIFVLDMGEPVKIYDLAEKMIRLLGYKPHVDIQIEIVGIRPGEKLYEELLMNEEGLQKTNHNKIFVGRPTFFDIKNLNTGLDKLKDAIAYHDEFLVKETLARIVPTYSYIQKNTDLEPVVSSDISEKPEKEVFVLDQVYEQAHT